MLDHILKKLSLTQTKLIAVSKTKPNEAIMELYERGQRHFGENRVQELITKYETLPKDIEWHFIGHLQTNKVKYIASFVHCIHSVDSQKILKEIEKQAAKYDRSIECLLQFHVAEEASKFGLDLMEAQQLLENGIGKHQKVKITGVMGMATFTHDMQQVRREFQQLKHLFDSLKESYFKQDECFKEISMGMSGDFEIAMEEGSTMVRIGSLLFGKR